MVEVNQKIPDRDEAELRLAVQVGEPSAASRVFDGTPASRAPLTLLPAREATGVAWHCKKRMKKDETTLDSADDVIHGRWQSGPKPGFRKRDFLIGSDCRKS